MNENKVAIRRHGKGDSGVQDVDEFLAAIKEEVSDRRAE
jgi:hypothetical protein